MDKQYSQLIESKICIPRLRFHIINRKRPVVKTTAESGAVVTLISSDQL